MQSRDKEEQVLLNEDERLRAIVRRFQMRAGIRYPDNTDDLCQEARVAL